MGLKEQLRGQVQKRLESLAYGCSDMATLLRRLGIAVEGGTYPSPQEVILCSLIVIIQSSYELLFSVFSRVELFRPVQLW